MHVGMNGMDTYNLFTLLASYNALTEKKQTTQTSKK